MSRRIRTFIIALLVAASGVATGCDPRASSTPPVPCSGFIPGADVNGDAVFLAWMDRQLLPLDYTESGFWYDASGFALGWSYQEDSEICLIDHTHGGNP